MLPARSKAKEYHVLKGAGHIASSTCPCKPFLLVTVPGGNQVWVHSPEPSPKGQARAIREAWRDNNT